MHEHFVFAYPGIQGDRSMSHKHYSKEEIENACIDQASKLVSKGFKTVVDATPNECGRDPVLLKKVSEATGLQIVCATGYYNAETSGTGYWGFRSHVGNPVDELTELFVHELTVGIWDTDIKAGIIKVASSYGEAISDYEKMFFKAAANAQKETGAVIYTHTSNGTGAEAQADVLVSYGADPSKVVIGHMDNYIVPVLIERVLEKGFYIGLDRCGQTISSPTDEIRLYVLKELIKKGYENRIVMSQDSEVFFLGRKFSFPKNLLYAFGEDFSMEHIVDKYIPMMKDAGITDNQINKFLEKNPCRLFS